MSLLSLLSYLEKNIDRRSNHRTGFTSTNTEFVEKQDQYKTGIEGFLLKGRKIGNADICSNPDLKHRNDVCPGFKKICQNTQATCDSRKG